MKQILITLIPYFKKKNEDDFLYNITAIESEISIPKYLNNHEKFNVMNEAEKKLAQLCSEVSKEVFYNRLHIIKKIISKRHQDTDLINVFPNLSNYKDQSHHNLVDTNGKLIPLLSKNINVESGTEKITKRVCA